MNKLTNAVKSGMMQGRTLKKAVILYIGGCKMEVIQGSLGDGEWVYDVFANAYADKGANGLMKMFTIVDSDDLGSPDATSILCVRLFIEGGKELITGQKYIMGLRFYNFGDMASLDIISLDKPYHREIAMAHAEKMCWTQEGENENLFRKSDMIPLMVVGGFLSVFNEDVELAGHSQDFGGNLLGGDVNALAWYITSLCGLSDVEDPAGKRFVADLLAFMKEHRGKNDFYERLAQMNSANTGKHCSAMLMMKVMDRLIAEGTDDLYKVITDEVADGFAREYVKNNRISVLRQ